MIHLIRSKRTPQTSKHLRRLRKDFPKLHGQVLEAKLTVNEAAFVVSLNLHRRYLNESQRAMVAAKLANLDNGIHAATSIDVAVTQPESAKMLNVGVASVQRAKQVLKKGTPETIAAVESGALPVSVATQRICADDTEALDLIDRVVQEKQGERTDLLYIM